jgi:aminomuconate-semialdehyde/2-hydroxymuconate-6-semialdehyde dehydrogenase
MTREVLNFIGGEYTKGFRDEWIDSVNPATEEVIARVVNSSNEDVEAAILAASSAQENWARTSAQKRAGILRKMASLIEERLEELAAIETSDNGKPIGVSSTVDIPRAAVNLKFFADAITQFSQDSYSTPHALNFTKRSPLGIVTCISPWNLPLYLFTWKIAPALASGNCVIAKPSEVTPITASLMGEIANQAGLPKGVLNILHGQGPRIGTELVTRPEIKAVSFTGSTATGRAISEMAAKHFKKVSLEMGGKNPTVVFDDCDYKKTLSGVMRAAFSNQGQICLCGSRILIQDTIYEQFKSDLIELTEKLIQGDPTKKSTQQGALVSEAHFEKVMSCIETAKSEAGTILTGGSRFGNKGFFIKPTLIEGLGPESTTNQEEIFGPVATLQSFSTPEQAIELANATRYGLSASVWTKDIQKANEMADKIDAGIVWLNTWMLRDLRTPFGGVKESGVGREGGQDALRFFSEVKNICLQY